MVFLLAFLFALVPPAVRLAISPQQCFAPCTVRARVTVEPHPLNRYLVVMIDGGMMVSETRQLDGDRAPKTTWFDFRDLTPGEYAAVAVVFRADAQHSEAGRAVAVFDVHGSGQ